MNTMKKGNRAIAAKCKNTHAHTHSHLQAHAQTKLNESKQNKA